jgi:hypothetical protein
MIPGDQYTIVVIILLTFLGLTGIFKPRWFIVISRFPYLTRNYPPITDAHQRIARRWGVLSLVGAVILVGLSS